MKSISLMKKIARQCRMFAVLVAAVFFSHLAMAQTSLINLLAEEAGMHRISYEQLAAAGADLAGLRHGKFSLVSQGESVPIRTKGQDKSLGRTSFFGPGGWIEFYADAPNDLYNNAQAYTLNYVARGATGRVNFGKLRARYNQRQAATTSYIQTRVFEENRYYDYLSPSKTDPWHYGQVFNSGAADKNGTSVPFDLDELAGSTASLDVEVYGIVDIQSEGNDHHVVAKVNGVEVGDQQFDGNIRSVLSIAGVPVTSSNTFQMVLRSIATTPFDAMGLNKVTVHYPRNAIAEYNYLEGEFSGSQALVSGLTDNSATVYLKRAQGIDRLTNTRRRNGTVGFAILEQGDYVVVGRDGYKLPSVAMIADEEDISTGSAEYLILTHANFLGAELDQLVALRGAEYSVKVVDVAQVYAQYGNHLPSADAISNYIKFAVDNLGTRFVALIGSDTYDYKNYKSASISYIPTRYAETPGGLLFIRQTPSDASYGDVDGDGVQDVAIGRFSVRTKAELATVMNKINAFEARAGYAGRILVAADKEDVGNGISFTSDINAMIEAIPQAWRDSIRDDFRAFPDIDGDQVAHDKLITGINAGAAVTSYIGHSSQQSWSRATPPLFRASEIASLTNIGKPTLVTQWGCWNTYFVDPSGNSMADRFLVGGEMGAVAVLGASTLTTSEGERGLGIEMNSRMYNPGMTIGEALVAAKQAFAVTDPDASDILLGWQIIGDPALKISP